MSDEQIRSWILVHYLKPYSSRSIWDRWNHPDSLRAKQLELEDKIADAQRKIASHLIGPIEEVASLLREFWNSQPGMPYTAPSLWDAAQMAAAR